MKPQRKAQSFKVIGTVREQETRRPLTGLTVKPYDLELRFANRLKTAKTDAAGCFQFDYEGVDFSELFDSRPEITFQVLDARGRKVLHLAADSVPWQAGSEVSVEIEIPSYKLAPRDSKEVQLLDAQGVPRKELEVGDTLLFSATSLASNQSHQVRLLDERKKEILSASLAADRFGVIPPTVLWPDMGIGEPEKGGRFAFRNYEEAHVAMAGKTFSLEVRYKRRVVRQAKLRIGPELARTRLYPVSESGFLQRGLLLGRDRMVIDGRRFPPGALIDVYLVPSQHDWRPGDPIVPVRNPDGSEVFARVHLGREETGFRTVLWPRERVRPGRYDMIARTVIPHEFRADERVLRPTDIVSDRLITSVVVRDDIFRYKPIQMGCINAMREMAGKKLAGSPYFEFTNNFPRGTDVWATLDPAGLPAGAIGRKIRYYVVAHKTAAQWSANSSLADVTGTVKEVILTSSCINGNEALVWPNPQTAGQYDLVADFGNNNPDPSQFASDDSFDPPLDMVDGYLNVGFYVTDDPSMPGTFAIGQTSYSKPAVTIPATGVWAPPAYGGVLGNTLSGTLSLPLVAEVRYPADVGGANVPVSTAQANYPVVVVMHGMHTTADPSYLGYNYLLDHLASHGFIAVSIDCNAINAINGMQDTRGHAILEHLSVLQSLKANPGLFQGKIDMNNIAIMGHSRGGDGVVQAEIYNQSLTLGWNIKAVIALAPTDFSGISPSPLVLMTSKFLCVYGSNDGDVWGGSNPSTQYAGTGFRFYDRAAVEKAMVFIYGATHNRFNTQWGTEWKVDAASPKVLSEDTHHKLLMGYMTAFVQAHVQGRVEQLDYFKGELKIPQVSSVDLHTQYRPAANVLALDNFETAPALNQNTLGGAVTFANLDGNPQEDAMGTIDPNSPHQTRGIRLKWNASTANYRSEIPLAGTQRDISGRKSLSFRVSQKAGSASNPLDQLQDLYVRLTTAAGGNSRAVRAGYFRTIPFPYKPEYIPAYDTAEGPNTKAALKSVLIPLHSWTVKALSAPIVDLTNIESITFEFSAKPAGEIEIDDIEFIN